MKTIMKNIHYYLSDNDTIWAEIDGKVHIYNYEKKEFILCDRLIDVMKWHEFPARELKKIIQETAKSFELKL